MADGRVQSIVLPLAAVASVGLAVGVWLVPVGALTPDADADADRPRIDLGGGGGGPDADDPDPRAGAVGSDRESRWTQLAAVLDSLREPEPEEQEPSEQPDEPPPEVQAANVFRGWEYRGSAIFDDGAIAWMTVYDVPRTLRMGEPVDMGNNLFAEIVAITPREVRLRLPSGITEVIEREGLDEEGPAEGEGDGDDGGGGGFGAGGFGADRPNAIERTAEPIRGNRGTARPGRRGGGR
jgi:hypothetical protein